jgi:hypothetical protein
VNRFLSAILALSFAIGLGSAASAKTCRDKSGKFTKCPSMMASPKPKQCRDSSGKFTKCSTSMSSMKGSMKGMKMASPAPKAT